MMPRDALQDLCDRVLHHGRAAVFPHLMIPIAYIPTFNGRDRLRQALESIRNQSRRCEVVVVDNASDDGTAEMVRAEFPDCGLFELDRNRGFGQALNEAIAATGSGPVMVLNNDVVLQPDFVEQMMAVFERGAPVVCGVLVRSADPGLIDSAGVVADRRTLMAFDYLEGSPVAQVAAAGPPLGATGGAALYDRDAFNSVGGFDPEIFAYYEDLDLALRLRSAGYAPELAPLARATHLRSSTLGDRSAAKYALTGWSRGYLLRRYRVLGTAGGLARTLVAEIVVCSGQLVIDRTANGIRGRVRGWKAAKGLSARSLPSTGLTDFSFRAALKPRIRRYL